MTTVAAQPNNAVLADLSDTDEILVHRVGQTVGQPLIFGELRKFMQADSFAGGLVGVGTIQATAVLLAAHKNIATTVTGTNNAFKMPVGTSPLSYCFFFNDDVTGGDNAQLFPNTGEDLGAGVNLPILVAVGDWVGFAKKSASTWFFLAGTMGVP